MRGTQVSRLSRARWRFRQRRFPPEFRIGEPEWPFDGRPPDATEREPVPQPEEPVRRHPAEPPVADLPDEVLADVVTNLWRTTRKVLGDGEPDRAQRQAARHLRATWSTLAEAGVEAKDHDGLQFDSGMSLDVAAYETRPGLTAETVVETVQPSVYRAGRCIQIGQVIVGQPERDTLDVAYDD